MGSAFDWFIAVLWAVADSQSSATPSTEEFVRLNNKQEMDRVHKFQNMNGWSSGETAVLFKTSLESPLTGPRRGGYQSDSVKISKKNDKRLHSLPSCMPQSPKG